MTYKQLAYEERFYIEKALISNKSLREIAKDLGRSPSTISREIRRNKINNGSYIAMHGQQFHRVRKLSQRKPSKITEEYMEIIIEGLKQFWSPEQIVNKYKLPFSVTTVYNAIHRFTKKSKNPLFKYLRRRGKKYKKKQIRANLGCQRITDRISIHERPSCIEQRCRIGDWEADTLQGKGYYTAIVNLTDRLSGFVQLIRVYGKESKPLAEKINEVMLKLKDKVHSITFDNDVEFYHHHLNATVLECETYFADPSCPWQRGTNENTNSLIRQYFPKGTDLRELTQEQLNEVARALNQRPRKRLGYRTPESVFYSVALET